MERWVLKIVAPSPASYFCMEVGVHECAFHFYSLFYVFPFEFLPPFAWLYFEAFDIWSSFRTMLDFFCYPTTFLCCLLGPFVSYALPPSFMIVFFFIFCVEVVGEMGIEPIENDVHVEGIKVNYPPVHILAVNALTTVLKEELHLWINYPEDFGSKGVVLGD